MAASPLVEPFGLSLGSADGLIKLHRAGVLHQVVVHHPCTIPQAVYDEVVTRGKVRLYQDADEIEEIIVQAVRVVDTEPEDPEPGLGAGEMAVLRLATQNRYATVVSDDRRFLALLSARAIPFLTPTDLLVVLAGQKDLTREEASEALERLRPVIRAAAYWEAREDLQRGGRDEE